LVTGSGFLAFSSKPATTILGAPMLILGAPRGRVSTLSLGGASKPLDDPSSKFYFVNN
jgi:hypothetical protein